MLLHARTVAISEAEESTQHKSKTADRGLRLHRLVLALRRARARARARKRRRPATSVHGFVLAVRRARARARAIMGLYHVGSVDAQVQCEFAMRWTKEDRNHCLRDEPMN